MTNNQQKEPINKVFTIPNLLSAVRILLIPVFLYLYISKKDYLFATIIIIISGFTDVVDGYIARNFGQISKVGKVLDPTADKLTQAAIVVALSFRFDYMFIVFSILALKEGIMLVLGAILYKHTKEITGSRWHGKLAALVVYIMLLTHLIWGIKAEIPLAISYVSIVIAIFFMIFTLVMYTKEYIALYKERDIIKKKE